MNEMIRAPRVQVIASDGAKIGILALEEALELARSEGVDLVEVAPGTDPPVCRIMDYKKMRYEKTRKMKEARKHQRQVDVKVVKLRPNIDEHDYQVKLQHLREFLLKGNKSRITLQFRAREMRRYEIGRELVARMVNDVKDIAVVESTPSSQGRMIVTILTPTKEVMAEAERHFREELEQRKEEHDRRIALKHVGERLSKVVRAERKKTGTDAEPETDEPAEQSEPGEAAETDAAAGSDAED